MIICQGEPVSIGYDLASALQHLRLRNRERLLWVDVLCINQTDLDEKSSQVAQMGRVYSGASCVVAWLGDGLDGMGDAFPKLEELAGSWAGVQGFSSFTHNYWRHGSLDDDKFEQICLFFGSSYFERKWAVQEIVLARDASLRYGKQTILLDIVGDSLMYLATLSLPSGFPMDLRVATTRLMIDLAKSGREIMPFPYLLDEFKVRKSVDPRDKIFALIGLLSSHDLSRMSGITLDYKIDVTSLYANVTISIIAADENLDILSTCQTLNRTIKDLPSSTPDWSHDYSLIASSTLAISNPSILTRNCISQASAQRTANVSRRGVVLIAKGVMFDTTEAVAEPFSVVDAYRFIEANQKLQLQTKKDRWFMNKLSAMQERAN